MIRFNTCNLPGLEDVHEELKHIWESKQVVTGKYTEEFEQTVADIHKVDYAVATSNATTAMAHLLDILKPKKVALPMFEWDSIKMILDYMKIEKEFVDINPRTFLADFTHNDRDSDLHIPVDLFGNLWKGSPFNDQERTIVDAAHSFGVKGVGHRGIAEILSFAPIKPITAIEAGVVLTNNKYIADEVRRRRRFFGRMSEINAIIGLKNIENMDQVMKRKEEIWTTYKGALPDFQFQKITKSNYYIPACLTPDAEYIREKLKDQMNIRGSFKLDNHKLVNTQLVSKQMIRLPSGLDVDTNEVLGGIQEVLNEIK